MADLSVEFAGIKFKNPILIGSSSLTNHIEKLKRLEQAGKERFRPKGALGTKSFSRPRW